MNAHPGRPRRVLMLFSLRAGSRSRLLALVLLLLLLGFAFQGSRNLWETDEGRYTNVALQMMASNHYLMPALNDETPHFSKPPITYWTIAAAIRLFGHSAWAVRAPYALAFVLTGLLLFGMGKRITPEQPWLAPLIYASSLGPSVAANVVSTDGLLVLWEALAMFGYIAFWHTRGRGLRRYFLWIMWLGFALAFETKGPPGLLPLLAVLVFTGVREGRHALRRLFTFPGVLTFIVLGLSWYVVVIWKRPALAHYFLHYEVIGRIFTGVQHRNPQWYGWFTVYVPVLIVGVLPWWPAALRGLKRLARPRVWRAMYRRRPAHFFLLMWFLLPLLIFCLSSSRLPLYVWPLFLPLSLLLALQLRGRMHLNRPRRRAFLVFWVVVLLTIKAALAFWVHPGRDDFRYVRTLNAQVRPETYGALVFVYRRMHEGMRFYLGKPIYHVPYGRRKYHRDRLLVCRALHRHPDALYAVYDPHVRDFLKITRRCDSVQMKKLGSWDGKTLFRETIRRRSD